MIRANQFARIALRIARATKARGHPLQYSHRACSSKRGLFFTTKGPRKSRFSSSVAADGWTSLLFDIIKGVDNNEHNEVYRSVAMLEPKGDL